jgi:hypothetical protein
VLQSPRHGKSTGFVLQEIDSNLLFTAQEYISVNRKNLGFVDPDLESGSTAKEKKGEKSALKYITSFKFGKVQLKIGEKLSSNAGSGSGLKIIRIHTHSGSYSLNLCTFPYTSS